ncbi:hypothetical protein OCHUTO_1080 [Orientia chuto str. Dubai]|uniref:Uncharacterized protein n=1 Tax=Orientia chuto str. Dubai TaxID=1359168 RepID=A0A0F3MJG9_9RICK|nr:hypothetical protein OCHUTO_1080 [Orientia chuto str. Dubai]
MLTFLIFQYSTLTEIKFAKFVNIIKKLVQKVEYKENKNLGNLALIFNSEVELMIKKRIQSKGESGVFQFRCIMNELI